MKHLICIIISWIRKSTIHLLLVMILITCFTSCSPESLEPTPSPVPSAIPSSTKEPIPTKTATPQPTDTQTPSVTPSITPTPIYPVGKIALHEPDNEIIYSWYSYIPRGLSKDKTIYILITGLNGGLFEYQESVNVAKSMLEERLRWPNINQFVLLVPVIPRRDVPHVYPIAFDLNSFKERSDFYSRADLKVILMINKLISMLVEDGYTVSDKVMLEGYSSGGMFSQRFALLHPDRVKAIAAGQCGGQFVLPITEYEGELLNWPVGINNLNLLTGLTFDLEAYKTISQYIFIGDLDTGEGGTTTVWNRLHPTWGPQYMWESVQQMEFLHNTFGDTDPLRLLNEIAYLNNNGFENIKFKMYPGVAHQLTPSMIKDFMNFLVEQSE